MGSSSSFNNVRCGNNYDYDNRNCINVEQNAYICDEKQLYDEIKSLKHDIKVLYEENNNLRTNNNALKDIINTIAHELRTPTTYILGILELLEYDNNKQINYPNMTSKIIEITEERFYALNKNAKRIEKLIADILDLARIENNSFSLHKERFCFNELLIDLIEEFRKDISRKGKDLQILLHYDQPRTGKVNKIFHDDNACGGLMIKADKNKIIQVISNLLNNATRFAHSRIDIYLTNELSNLLCSVKDDGVGIDDLILPHIFKRYVTKSSQGLGLGLFLSQCIIEAHQGRIWADNNRDGRGAIFSFTLPT